MSLAEQIAALRTKAAAGDKNAIKELKGLGISVKADADAEADEGESTDAGADDGKDNEGTDVHDDADDEEEDGKEPEAKATGSKAGFAVVGSSKAKGREALAAKLGKKVAAGKLSYGEAMDMLAAAPKQGRLAEAMAGRDQNPGQDGGSKVAGGLGAAVDRFNAKRAATK